MKTTETLTEILNKILNDLGIGKTEILNKVERLELERSVIGEKIVKNNIIRRLMAPGVTWKTLEEFVFDILQVKKMKITIELTDQNDRVTVHESVIHNQPEKL